MPPPPPAAAQEKQPRAGKAPLYANITTPEVPVKKIRNPKSVNKGLEAAFRKRQNLKLKESKDEVLALFGRVLGDPG